MAKLDEWTTQVSTALEVPSPDASLVLDLARDVARGVLRPAAPLSTYLLGVAVGRGADPAQAAAIITDLAASWPQEPED